ncbi:HesA/MoeB/ThiF family protein [Paracoccus jeotgali]|nr:HesA/MoeB/ThiF family protein [Paracoccus jeotgali]
MAGAALALMAVGWWRGWSLPRVLILLAALWLLVLALLLIVPALAAQAGLGADPRVWAVGGLLLAGASGYGALIGRARIAAHRRWGAGQIAPPGQPQTVHDTSPASDDALERYARHIVLREIGGPGQQMLRKARVLIVGAGGIGSPVALYLAGAGVGHLTLADDDDVSISNLQRQILFRTRDAGRAKVDAAVETLRALNPLIEVTALPRRLGAEDAEVMRGFDLVLEGTDSFASRKGVARACVAAGVPLIAGAIAQWEGQVTIYDPNAGTPCLDCLFPDAPAPGLALSCAEAGVAGPLPGVIGSIMALEAIKAITGAGQGLRGQMLIFDGLWGETRRIALQRRADCAVCGGIPA